jgi:hypothetical protein
MEVKRQQAKLVVTKDTLTGEFRRVVVTKDVEESGSEEVSSESDAASAIETDEEDEEEEEDDDDDDDEEPSPVDSDNEGEDFGTTETVGPGHGVQYQFARCSPSSSQHWAMRQQLQAQPTNFLRTSSGPPAMYGISSAAGSVTDSLISGSSSINGAKKTTGHYRSTKHGTVWVRPSRTPRKDSITQVANDVEKSSASPKKASNSARPHLSSRPRARSMKAESPDSMTEVPISDYSPRLAKVASPTKEKSTPSKGKQKMRNQSAPTSIFGLLFVPPPRSTTRARVEPKRSVSITSLFTVEV